MTEIVVTQRMERSSGDVFAVLADMSQNRLWQKGMQSCEWTSEPPLQLGTTYDQTASFLGREIRTSFDSGERIRIVSIQSTFPLDITRSVSPVTADSCDVEAIVRGEPGMPFKLLGPVLDRMVRRSVTGDYLRLKPMLEGEAP